MLKGAEKLSAYVFNGPRIGGDCFGDFDCLSVAVHSKELVFIQIVTSFQVDP